MYETESSLTFALGHVLQRPRTEHPPIPPVRGPSSIEEISLSDPRRQRFAHAAKIADFNAKDLAAPEPERTRGHLSAFINLVKFSEQRADFIKDLRTKSASINQERVEVSRKLEEAEREVATIKCVNLPRNMMKLD